MEMEAASFYFGPLAATFLIGITTIILSIWYSVIKQTYWKKRGVPYVTPLPILGSITENLRKPFHDVELQRYKKFGAIYGHYEGNRPLLSVGDPKLLRDILVKDFTSFANRRTFKVGDETLDKMMSVLEGEDWKRVRTVVTPTFSTGKLKRVLSIFKDCAQTLVHNFKTASERGDPINAKRLYGALAMDVIASSAFSTKLDSHNDPENKFTQMARKAFSTSVTWRFAMFLLLPRIMRTFRISVFDPRVTAFFSNLTKEIIERRKQTGQKRNDFLQLLIDTAEDVAREEKWEDNEKDSDLASNYGQEIAGQKLFKTAKKSLSMNELIAQCVIFFLAGYDTTASTLSFASYSLATNQNVQDKAREEINQCLKDANGELTYESLQNMKYLDNVISETLRLYPPAFRLERKVDSDYKLGDTGITLPKDMIITIPNFAIHKDPNYFPNPEKFDPNRFTVEERAKRDPYAYLPFGAGPRNCVGMRFALLEIKMCLAHVISLFDIKTCPQTTIPIEFHSGVGLLQPKDIFLKMVPREDSPLKK